LKKLLFGSLLLAECCHLAQQSCHSTRQLYHGVDYCAIVLRQRQRPDIRLDLDIRLDFLLGYRTCNEQL